MSNQNPDSLQQAGELLIRFTRGERICAHGGIERDAAAVIAAVGYAQAVEMRRVADLLAVLVGAVGDSSRSEGLIESARIWGTE